MVDRYTKAILTVIAVSTDTPKALPLRPRSPLASRYNNRPAGSRQRAFIVPQQGKPRFKSANRLLQFGAALC